MMKNMIMRYFSPAQSTNEGWEKYSLPIGNGYFGASVFGGTESERIQFTTNTFANPYALGGVSNFGEIFIDFNHKDVRNYERGLDLNSGTIYSSYETKNDKIYREALVNYPDKVFAYKIHTENDGIDFDIRFVIPYLDERSIEEGGRTGKITLEEKTLVMRGTLPSRELIYEARLAVVTDGDVVSTDNKLTVKNSTEAVLFYTLDTSYKLCPEVFMDNCHKALGDDPHQAVVNCLENALSLGWDEVYKRHISDYTKLIGRVNFDLGGSDDGRSTEELLLSYQNGNKEPYLEELYYAFGRHLLVSSSRDGTPPASLQGVWTVHDKSPWGSGIWHNINVQMNYWPAFTTNLTETFKAYADYWKNYSCQAAVSASRWIKDINPENYKDGDGECGWIVGTGGFMYEIDGMSKNTHSGPGTGGMTSKMFWDYYDFTRDETVLKDYSYPVIHGMSKFLTKCVKNYDGRYLCSYSASPEQIISGGWVHQHKMQQYWHTVGCGFDQQFIYENAVDDLKCAEILGVNDDVLNTEKEQLDAYGPVQIGYSGQIKEYDEEHFYGEIGQAHHRHISQLVALTPGSTITRSTPAWLDAARITLNLRGEGSSGWSAAHRLNAWARVGDGNRAYSLLQKMLKKCTHPNLWDVHPPFQIDGNFGATAGMTEMVLQSHEGYISLLPSLPDDWTNVSFKGLKTRGNFTIDCNYNNGKIQNLKIKSEIGGSIKLRYEGFGDVSVVCEGDVVESTRDGFFLTFDTEKGKSYELNGFITVFKRELADEFTAKWCDNGVSLAWKGNADKYAIFRAKENESEYSFVAETNDCKFIDTEYNSNNKARLTYKIICADNDYDSSTEGALATLHPATQLEEERYRLLFEVLNQNLR